MTISRRTALIGIGASGAALFMPAGSAAANLVRENWPVFKPIFARHWSGYGRTGTAGTADGQLAISLEVDLSPDDAMRINGRLQMTSNWESGTYSATYAINGYCWGTENAAGVLIENTALRSGDSLPPELYWQGLTGKLGLFRANGKEDSWLLDGTLYGTRDGNAFDVQLGDNH
ncbi:MAG: hypothetical protein ABL914_04970 [Novosphingobium sp.]|uniref:hypothetical protein n=1 Tax=Novosphingobium sp. TaxID=1874826 RepID=UPI0032BBC64E